MSRNKRLMLMPGAAVAVALSLALGSVGAADDEDSMEDMDSMDSMEQMEPGLNVRHAWTRPSPMMDLACPRRSRAQAGQLPHHAHQPRRAADRGH